MRKRNALVLVVILSLAVGFLPAAPMVPSVRAEEVAPIRLKAATFTPALGEEPDVPLSLRAAEKGPDEIGEYLVQFSGPIRPEWLPELERLDAQLGAYIPDYAFRVKMTGRAARRVAQLDPVAWVGDFHPAYKLSPYLTREGRNPYRLLLDPGADLEELGARIKALGGRISALEEGWGVIDLEAIQVDALATLPGIDWVTDHQPMELHNDVATGEIHADSAWAAGWTGADQVVAVADTGIDTGRDSLSRSGDMHADLDNRFLQIASWPIQSWASGIVSNLGADDGAADVDSGHGTHVTGSVAGSGARSGGRIRGSAPNATLVFQALEQYVNYNWYGEYLGREDGYYLYGIPGDLNTLFQQAYGWGARIHTNSWGGGDPGVYDAESQDVDEFIWNHKDMTVLFSAGNDGIDANRNGKVDQGSVTSPATSKNAIGVGASENKRLYPSPNLSSGTYGGWWPSDFPVDPLRGDLMADAGSDGMVAFSSRGPTADGRIKPDVVAPGTWILSTRSSKANSDGWGTAPNQYYMYNGGTSMSAPLVAGAAAVVREFYVKGQSHPNPSAALIKATLINTAVDMPGQYSGSLNDAGPIPNNDEGWGAVNVAAAVDGDHRYFQDQTVPLTTGQSRSFPLEVLEGMPLKVTVAWSDYPGAVQAGVELVNDLDLTVTAPDGKRYLGNTFGNGWSAQGGTADRRNNVECVYIQRPVAGTYQIQISGRNVPQGPQPFALVATANLRTTCTELYAAGLDHPAESAVLSGTVTVDGWAADLASPSGTGVTAVEIWLDGAKLGDATYGFLRQDIAATWGARFAPSGYRLQWNTQTISNGSHTVAVRILGACGWETLIQRTVLVQNLPCQMALAIDAPSAGATVSGQVAIAGWALDLLAKSGNGIEKVSLFLDGEYGFGTHIGDVTQFSPRADLAAILGAQFLNSGYSLLWDTRTASNGVHTIHAQAYSATCGYSLPATRQVVVNNALCQMAVAIDAPSASATVRGTVDIAGWALDQRASVGNGLDRVSVYLDGDRNTGTHLGSVAAFTPRTDLASVLGSQFLNSGYSLPWDTTGISNGTHTLYVYAHSPRCGFSEPAVRQITVANAQCDMVLAIDHPSASATIRGQVAITGWALDRLSASGIGLDKVSLYLDGPAGTGTPLGDVTAFSPRQDLANVLGSQFLNSGYTFLWDTRSVANGPHTLYVYAHSPVCGLSAPAVRTVTIQNPTAACLLTLAVDGPSPSATVSGQVIVGGWAVNQLSTSGTGIDAVRVYLDGDLTTGTLLQEITSFGPRPDIAALLGAQFLNAGYQFSWNTATVPNGAHTLYVYAHSPVCGWSSPVPRQVTVSNGPAVLLLSDDFSDPNSGWFVGSNQNGTYEYLNGKYRLLVKAPNWTIFSTAPGVRCVNCRVEAQAEFASTAYGFYGLIWAVQDDWSAYHLHVDAQGLFAIYKLRGSTWQLLQDWTSSPYLRLGQAFNRLAVERQGTAIRVFANDQLLMTLNDAEFTGNLRVGVVAGSYGDTPVDARFDNFRVYSLTPLAQSETAQVPETEGLPSLGEIDSPER